MLLVICLSKESLLAYELPEPILCLFAMIIVKLHAWKLFIDFNRFAELLQRDDSFKNHGNLL